MADPTSTMTEAANAASVISVSGILPWLQVFLMPVVVLVTAYAAWLVQRSVLSRRAAFDYGVPLIYEWQHAKPFVQAVRSTDKGDEKYFCKFEELATSQKFKKLSKWSDD